MENMVCGLCVFFSSVFGSLKYGRCEKKGLSTEYRRPACSDCKARRTMPRSRSAVVKEARQDWQQCQNLNAPGQWDWEAHGEASDGFSKFVTVGSDNAPGNQTMLSRMQVEMSVNLENTVIHQPASGKGSSWKPNGDVEFFVSKIFGNVFPLYEGYRQPKGKNYKKVFLSEALRNIEKYPIATRRHLSLIVCQVSDLTVLAADFGILKDPTEWQTVVNRLTAIFNDLMPEPEKQPAKGSEKLDMFICRLNQIAEGVPRMTAGKHLFECPETDEAWKSDYRDFQYRKLEADEYTPPRVTEGCEGRPYRSVIASALPDYIPPAQR